VDQRVNLRDPWLAGILAFVLPGLGHLYQGRVFKATIYAVCILGLFFSGMALAGWRAVQAPPFTHRDIDYSRLETLKFLAQAPVGLPVLAAVIQSHRYYSADNQEVTELQAPLSGTFTGEVKLQLESGLVSEELTGSLELVPAVQEYGTSIIAGDLQTTLKDKPTTLALRQVRLEKPVRADSRRYLEGQVVEVLPDRENTIGSLRGSIPRPAKDWVEVPLDENQQQELHRELGKYHELAMVFTWVAGLLNILAIWDAVEGPAYGYGDEDKNPVED
jgi:hypothetical protein